MGEIVRSSHRNLGQSGNLWIYDIILRTFCVEYSRYSTQPPIHSTHFLPVHATGASLSMQSVFHGLRGLAPSNSHLPPLALCWFQVVAHLIRIAARFPVGANVSNLVDRQHHCRRSSRFGGAFPSTYWPPHLLVNETPRCTK